MEIRIIECTGKNGRTAYRAWFKDYEFPARTTRIDARMDALGYIDAKIAMAV